jgi:hypothetical protein
VGEDNIMTSWMEERDRLVAQTLAFVQGVAAATPFRSAAPPAVAPVPPHQAQPTPLPASPRLPAPVSERDEIMQRVAAFKAHQHRLIKERESYYASVQSQIRTVLGNDVTPRGL